VTFWDSVPVQRCTVHKHRNLLAHAPERLHQEITEDYNEMIYGKTPEEIEKHRKAFIRKWRLKHEAVAISLEEAGDRLFTFTTWPRAINVRDRAYRLHSNFWNFFPENRFWSPGWGLPLPCFHTDRKSEGFASRNVQGLPRTIS
jgi:hypothetical protein